MKEEQQLNSDSALEGIEIKEVNSNNALVQSLLNIFNEAVNNIISSDKYDVQYKEDVKYTIESANDIESLIANISLLASCGGGKKSGDSNPVDLSKNIQSVNYHNSILQNIHQLFSTYHRNKNKIDGFQDIDYCEKLVKNIISVFDINNEDINRTLLEDINRKLLILSKTQLNIMSNNGEIVPNRTFGKENRLYAIQEPSKPIAFDYDSLLLRTNLDKKAFVDPYIKGYVSFLPYKREQIYKYQDYSDDILSGIIYYIQESRDNKVINTRHLSKDKLEDTHFKNLEEARISYFSTKDFKKLNENESKQIIIDHLNQELKLLSYYPYRDEIDDKYKTIYDQMFVDLTNIDSRFDHERIYQLYSDLYDFNRKVYSVEYNREHGRLFNDELNISRDHVIDIDETEDLSLSNTSDEAEDLYPLNNSDLYPLNNLSKQSFNLQSIIKPISIIQRLFNRKNTTDKIGDQVSGKNSINFDSLQIPAIDMPSTSGIKDDIIEEESRSQDNISFFDSEIKPGSPLYEFLGGIDKFRNADSISNNEISQNDVSLGELLSEDNNKTEITKNIKNVRKFVSSCMSFCFRGVNKKTIVKRNKAIESPRISL